MQYKPGASPVSLTTLEPATSDAASPDDADKAGRRRRRRRGPPRGPGGEGGEGTEGGGENGPGGEMDGGGDDEIARADSGSRPSPAGDGGSDPSQS